MPRIVWIALGGAGGTIARYYVSTWALDRFGPGFPVGTLTVNVVGSFLLGLLFAVGQGSEVVGPTLMLALTTGFMGGFTTYSTFSLDTFKMLQLGAWGAGGGYVAVTVLGCLLGTALGYAAGAWLVASPVAAR